MFPFSFKMYGRLFAVKRKRANWDGVPLTNNATSVLIYPGLIVVHKNRIPSRDQPFYCSSFDRDNGNCNKISKKRNTPLQASPCGDKISNCVYFSKTNMMLRSHKLHLLTFYGVTF